jgi:hypothetical protein
VLCPAGGPEGPALSSPTPVACLLAAALQALQQAATVDVSTAPVYEILSPVDEVSFWAELAANPASAGNAAKAAQQVGPVFEGVFKNPFLKKTDTWDLRRRPVARRARQPRLPVATHWHWNLAV